MAFSIFQIVAEGGQPPDFESFHFNQPNVERNAVRQFVLSGAREVQIWSQSTMEVIASFRH